MTESNDINLYRGFNADGNPGGDNGFFIKMRKAITAGHDVSMRFEDERDAQYITFQGHAPGTVEFDFNTGNWDTGQPIECNVAANAPNRINMRCACTTPYFVDKDGNLREEYDTFAFNIQDPPYGTLYPGILGAIHDFNPSQLLEAEFDGTAYGRVDTRLQSKKIELTFIANEAFKSLFGMSSGYPGAAIWAIANDGTVVTAVSPYNFTYLTLPVGKTWTLKLGAGFLWGRVLPVYGSSPSSMAELDVAIQYVEKTVPGNVVIKTEIINGFHLQGVLYNIATNSSGDVYPPAPYATVGKNVEFSDTWVPLDYLQQRGSNELVVDGGVIQTGGVRATFLSAAPAGPWGLTVRGRSSPTSVYPETQVFVSRILAPLTPEGRRRVSSTYVFGAWRAYRYGAP